MKIFILIILITGWGVSEPKMQVVAYKSSQECEKAKSSWNNVSPDIKAYCEEVPAEVKQMKKVGGK